MQGQRLVELDYSPRSQFLPFHERTQRWACMVCHRRMGKTVAAINDQIKKGITITRPDARLGYIAPYRGQAKEVAWSYLKRFSQPLWKSEPRESDLSVTLLNGAILRLYGGDNPDAIRGGYLDDVIMDEFGDQRPSLWRDVVRPMLADRSGSATFIGTPKGKNEFYDVWQAARKDPSNWYSLIMPASKSGILPQDELDAMLQAMGTDRYMQELECSFEAAIHGAFYANQLRAMDAEKRVVPIQIDREVRVHTAWDLGISDSTAIWFIQCVGRERRLVDYYESSGVGLDHYADMLADKRREHRWIYGEHYFPHDIQHRELSSGKSRVQVLQTLGIDATVVPQSNVLDGIEATRKMLGRTWIDPDRCSRALDALRHYRREWDDKLNDWKSNPLHDWSSHGADALRTFACGYDDPDFVTPSRREAPSSPASGWAA
jgi:phage terminase large subunit